MGLLVSVEGNDGVGKSTVEKLLVAALRERGLSVAYLAFPNRETYTTGIFIQRFFSRTLPWVDGRDTLLRLDGVRDLPAETKEEIIRLLDQKMLQVLFSVNRREGIHGPGGLLDMLEHHDVVVTTRWLSAHSYGVANGVSRLQVAALEGDLPQADLSLLLDLDLAAARARRGQREGTPDPYEADDDFQSRVRDLYGDLLRADLEAAESEGRTPRWVRIDAALPPEEVAAQMVAVINERLAMRAIEGPAQAA